MSTFTKNLNAILEARHIAKGAFLKEIGYNKNAISQWEQSGKLPKHDTLLAIADKLGVTVGDLTGEEISSASLSDIEQEAVRLLRKMSPEAQLRAIGRLEEIVTQESVAADPELKQAK